MLTLDEIFGDVALSPGFENVDTVGVQSRGESGQTPMHWMATLGDVHALSLLISAKADIDAIDSDGNTPLHQAVISRQTLAVRKLIEYGADMHLKNRVGLSPSDVAKLDGFEPVMDQFTN